MKSNRFSKPPAAPVCLAARLGQRILIVDDEPAITRSLKLNLQAVPGYEVRTENESTWAIDAARDFRPDLILLDVLMPHLDGCDIAAQIHADPKLKNTPIVFLTALARNEDTGGRAITAGSTVYLAKPVNAQVLIKCIEQILSPMPNSQTRTCSFPI